MLLFHAFLRKKEFEQAALQFFCAPSEHRQWYYHWQKRRLRWWKQVRHNLCLEIAVLDVLSKNEATHSDMLDIMKTLQGYLGEEFPHDKKVVSGGDQLTCEREANARRHMMDGNTPYERLTLLEPVCEDWHALMCFLCVSFCMISK